MRGGDQRRKSDLIGGGTVTPSSSDSGEDLSLLALDKLRVPLHADSPGGARKPRRAGGPSGRTAGAQTSAGNREGLVHKKEPPLGFV